MENAQFERLLHEITESRTHTDEVAAALRDEMRQNTAETVGMLRDEMRQNAAETVGMLRDEMRQTVALLRDEMRRSTAETIAMLSERIESSAEESRRHFGVVAESLRHDDGLLAEGFATLDAKIDRVGAALRTEIVETRAMVKLSYVELDRRLSTLEAARAQ